MDPKSEKLQKYDRQLRLWGDHGQSLLESCKLCLINATSTGCEILKNLILPGIGSFTIIDEHVVTEEDLGNNFFLSKEHLGQKRAQAALHFLKELNDEVSGEFLDESLEELLKRSPEALCKYNVVIVSALPHRVLLPLSEYFWSHDIPFIVCQSYGMIGYLRLVVKNHTVIEAHPEHSHYDLRLTNPFPELAQFCDSIDLHSLNKTEHSHVPWLVLVYKALQTYKEKHDGNVPKTYKEKQVLKEILQQEIRLTECGVSEDEENFDEAIKAVNTAVHDSLITSTVWEILAHPLTQSMNSESTKFWILSRALKQFIEQEGELPLQGSIPDMTSDSKSYISLQQIYRDKAAKHAQLIHKFACEIIESIQGVRDKMHVLSG